MDFFFRIWTQKVIKAWFKKPWFYLQQYQSTWVGSIQSQVTKPLSKVESESNITVTESFEVCTQTAASSSWSTNSVVKLVCMIVGKNYII